MGLSADSDPGDLLASIAESLLAEPDFPHTAEQVVTFARETLAIDYAGITQVEDDRICTLVASDPLVEKADQLQLELDDGPCRDTAWQQQTLLVDDIRSDTRWPKWAAQVSALGFASLLAVQLGMRGRQFAALNLYCAGPRRFDTDEVAFAHLFGRHAAVALMAAQQEQTLSEAVDARTLIGQAQGILMERFGLGPDKAFGVLRRYSQDYNIKLRKVAEDLVSSGRLPG
jgi:GAF domain-containing protein